MTTKIMSVASRKQTVASLPSSVWEPRKPKRKTGAQQMSANVHRRIAAKMTSEVARILAARLAS
jgi:hypothetical protein